VHFLREARHGSRRCLLLQGMLKDGQAHVPRQQVLVLAFDLGLSSDPRLCLCLLNEAVCSFAHDGDLPKHVQVLDLGSFVHVQPWWYQQECLHAYPRCDHQHPLPACEPECHSPPASCPLRLSSFLPSMVPFCEPKNKKEKQPFPLTDLFFLFSAKPVHPRSARDLLTSCSLHVPS